ncbi:thiamine-phosphate kinase, putative [Babesia ovis]|uniref:Thiamine-phosphate kinase, putative n=1 Tax=Babesia ovis TaxID=5869 RepID=A0A9W5TB98_BABOV|nr:thiamine-phosphate kinase, putative [Babesia ovis]
MRIPSASPSGAVVNFETHCTEYFHPSVLGYILRNRAAYIAKQTHGTRALALGVREELWKISAAAISASCNLKPQTSATLLLSFAKTGQPFPELVKALTAHFDFDNATPKAIALTLNAFARQPKVLQDVDNRFWEGLYDGINRVVAEFSPCDTCASAFSITRILAANKGRYLRHSDAPLGDLARKTLGKVYTTMLTYTEHMLTTLDVHAFTTRDLTSILQAVYESKMEVPKIVIRVLERLKKLIPTSACGIDDTLHTLGLLPPPDLVGDTIEMKRIKRDIARAEKGFVEWSFDFLMEHLECLKDRELARIAAACNRLRSWSSDAFAISFAEAWERLLRKNVEIPPSSLSQGACYFLRRYEASVSKELAAEGDAEQQNASHVSDVCARIGEKLHQYALDNYSKHDLLRVEELIDVAEQCRAKRSAKQYQRPY